MRLARPRPRIRLAGRPLELRLLMVVAITLALGWVGLASTQAGLLSIGAPLPLMAWVGGLFGVHLAIVVSGRPLDQVLLPVTGLLGGLSMLMMQRMPQDLVQQRFGDRVLGLGDSQLLWLLLGLAVLGIVAVGVRSVRWLREYRYTWAAVGIALLAAVFLLGDEVNGARLTLRLGPISGQPSELLKVILVVFLAAYLADNRPLLARASLRVGPIALPPLPYLLPMIAMWGLAVALVVVQRDLGAALLLFGVFLALLYIATRRLSYVVLGLLLAIIAGALLYGAFDHVRTRIDVWLDPWADPTGSGYQVIRALFAFARGGVLGTGLGAGLPQVGSVPAIPLMHSDFVFAALGEELGLLGVVAIVGCYLLIVERGLRIAANAPDDFQSLLAAGLTLIVVVQAALIMAANLRLVPLTGVTLPFVSYGGSSVLTNGLVIGLLLALSDRRAIHGAPAPAFRVRRSWVGA
ncbi:MAG: FtsW/RodA/SpoVE family cell cycle protein [Chloroflexi bacterium]|nr:FtsW/RodA/SpoVE family cell cycle protein [Chloroflexota bacterium]